MGCATLGGPEEGSPVEDKSGWKAYPSAVRRIEGTAEHGRGWNGHDAPPIPKASREAALHFLAMLWNEFQSTVPEPTVVAPTSDEGVAFEWIVKDDRDHERGIEIVCLPGHRYEYSIRNRDTRQVLDDAETSDAGFILRNVIKAHVANHFVLPPSK